MHTCTNCGKEFEGKFCPDCGTKRENLILCPKCFAEVKDGARYCTECGLFLAEPPAEEKENIAEAAEEVAEDTAEQTAEEVAGEDTETEGAEESATEEDEDDGFGDELEETVEQPEEKSAKKKISKFAILHRALYFAPTALISLLSVLLWAFFAAPAATYDGQSYGNIYNFAGDGEYLVDLNGCAGALIAFAVIAALFSAFALCARFILPLASKKIKISIVSFRLTFALDCAAGVICLILFVIGAAVCGISRSAVSKTGASGPLILSFSLLFMLLIIGALVADFVLKKYVAAYAEEAKAHGQKIDSNAEQKAKLISEKLALTRENGEEIALPEKETNKKLAFGMYLLEKGKALLRMYTWLGIVLSFALVMYNFHYDRSTDVMHNALLIVARICIAAVVALAIGIAIHMLRPARVPDKKRLASLRTGYLLRAIWSMVLLFVILAYVIVGVQAVDGMNTAQSFGLDILGITPAGISLSIIFLYAVPFALSIASIVIIGKLDKKYFSRLPEGGYDNGLSPLAERVENRKKYAVYVYDTNRNARRAAAGKDVKTAKQYKKERALITAAAISAAFLLAAAVFFTVIFVPRNIYKTGKIESISVGDNMGYVYRTLGEPFDKEEGRGGGETWAYCSDSLARTIAKKTEQLERLTAQMSWDNVSRIESLEEEITSLETTLASRRCNYIYVSFQSDLVTSVTFEKNRRYSDEADRQVSKITYACEPVQNLTFGAEVYKSCYYNYEEKPTVSKLSISQGNLLLNVREYFTDGSLINKVIQVKAQSKLGLQTVEWKDDYGEHTLYMSVR